MRMRLNTFCFPRKRIEVGEMNKKPKSWFEVDKEGVVNMDNEDNRPICSTERCYVEPDPETTCAKCGNRFCDIVVTPNEADYKCQNCGYKWQIIKESRLKITEAMINKINDPEPNIGLTIKTIKGKKYVYKQETISDKQEEKCLGNVENEEVKHLVRNIIDAQLERALNKWHWLLEEFGV
jgi:DNA-directed RNA polymerase subunit RPC12/RpoP